MQPCLANTFTRCIRIFLLGSFTFAQTVHADDAAELANKLQNPVANLISVPMKLDWDTDIGPANADRSTYLVQPVIPINLNDSWNIISRTITPIYIDAESPVEGGRNDYGMGDILQSFFVSPKAPTASGWIWGAGPALSLPTGDDGLTSDKFSVGPTAVALKQQDGWTYGILWNHLWSVSGDEEAPRVNSEFLQPFLSFNTKTNTTFGVNTESTYNWETEDWTVPVNLTVAQLVKIGKRPVSFLAGYRKYAGSPPGKQDWGLRFQVTLLFPT
jgi:hypothetical protein